MLMRFRHLHSKNLQNASSKLMLCVLVLFFAVQANAQISGTVFRDFNANGTRNTGVGYNEPLVDGITVKAYDAANALIATTTTVSGAYSFSAGQIAPGTKVRLEFTGWAAGIDFPGAYGTNNKSSIQFATAPATGLHFGINYPGDYNDQTNPRVVVPVYANGDNRVAGSAANADAIYAYNYNTVGGQTTIGTMGQIGAVWGTAYNRQADKLYYAAYAKRHVNAGPYGLNGLYVTTNAKAVNNTASTGSFVNLNAINPAFNAGTVTRNFTPGAGDKTNANYDDAMFDAVGKKGMGGLAISDDGKYLYVVNLNDARLWRITLGPNGTAPSSASDIVSYPAFTNPSSFSSFRPFAVKYYRGAIYVGGVTDGVKPDNSAVDRNDLRAYVYKVDASANPGTASFTQVINVDLTFNRKANLNTGWSANRTTSYVDANGTNAALSNTSWHPWSRSFTEMIISSSPGRVAYPQPVLSSLEFDPTDGAMILGIADRTGDQTGNENFSTNTGSGTLYTGNSAGDILRASNTGAAYTSFVLENNGSVGARTSAGVGNHEGPGDGEFYFVDRFSQPYNPPLGNGDNTTGSWPYGGGLDHEETSTGSLALLAGKDEVLTTAFDPITDWYSGGVRYYSNIDGIANNGKKLYQGQFVDIFGKANGLGDLEIISAPAPIEIGNRVWLDADGNGIQDPGENPIAGVTVELVKAGLVIATATTDADGNYIFSSDPNGVTTASNIYNITGLTANTAFTIRVPNVTGGSKQAALGANDLTTANTAGGANADEIDSDGILNGVNAETTLTTGVNGANNHSYDFGFSTAVPCGCGGGLESKSLGDAVGRRIFNKAVNSQQGPVNYSKMPAVENRIIQNQIQGVGTSLTLSELLPKQIKGTNYKALTTTPTDIPSITNATDVLSIDFVLNDQAKAVSFATRTQGEVYDHTKAICDRLKGSELMGIENVTINNIKFVRYNLKNSLGQIEYAMSFAIGAKSGRLNYSIQSNWLNKDYTPDEVMYNVQLWAVSPELVMNMANDIVTRLKATMPVIEQVNSIVLPKTYVTKGKREAENLVLNIVNNSNFTNGYIELQEKANELSTSLITRQVPFTVGANGKTVLTIPASDSYEAAMYVYMNGVMQDQLFMADGSWVANVNPGTSTLKSFKVDNDPKMIVENKTDFLLFRNVKVEASSPDFVSVYKLLRGGGAPQDLTGYKTLQFNAKGSGVALQIILVKDGIQNWDDQYRLRIPLSSTNKDYKISLDDFKSLVSNAKINPNDITTVIFALEVNTGKLTNISAEFNRVLFSKTDYSYLSSLNSTEVNVFPNPSKGSFKASFKSAEVADLTLYLTDATGRRVYSQSVKAQIGENQVPVNFTPKQGNILTNYILSLDGNGYKYQPRKVIIE